MTLTVAQLRTFVTSSLVDDALQTLLDAAAASIVDVTGATGEVTEYLNGHYPRIVTSRLIGTVTSVTEDDVTLAADDYRASGYVLTRLDDGTNPRSAWGSEVVVVYASPDATAEYDRVQLELVKLDLAQNPGLVSQRIGDWEETYRTDATYEAQRADILASLTAAGGGMLVVE